MANFAILIPHRHSEYDMYGRHGGYGGYGDVKQSIGQIAQSETRRISPYLSFLRTHGPCIMEIMEMQIGGAKSVCECEYALGSD
jgi:hypothetical protein